MDSDYVPDVTISMAYPSVDKDLTERALHSDLATQSLT